MTLFIGKNKTSRLVVEVTGSKDDPLLATLDEEK